MSSFFKDNVSFYIPHMVLFMVLFTFNSAQNSVHTTVHNFQYLSLYQQKAGHLCNRFEKLVKLSGTNLTQYIYPMITYLQVRWFSFVIGIAIYSVVVCTVFVDRTEKFILVVVKKKYIYIGRKNMYFTFNNFYFNMKNSL